MAKLDGAPTNRLRYLGFLAFAFLIWYVGPRNLVQALAGTKVSYLLAALVLNLPTIALKTRRWQVLLLGAGIHLPFAAAWRAYAASIFIGCLTPGRARGIHQSGLCVKNLRGSHRQSLALGAH